MLHKTLWMILLTTCHLYKDSIHVCMYIHLQLSIMEMEKLSKQCKKKSLQHLIDKQNN